MQHNTREENVSPALPLQGSRLGGVLRFAVTGIAWLTLGIAAGIGLALM